MMTDQEKIAVIQAQIDGKIVEGRSRLPASYYSIHSMPYYPEWRHGTIHTQFNFFFYDYRVKPETTKIKLNDQYEAEIGPKETTVGCQTFSNSKILEVAKAIKSQEDHGYIPAQAGDVVTSEFRFRRHGVLTEPVLTGHVIPRRFEVRGDGDGWMKPRSRKVPTAYGPTAYGTGQSFDFAGPYIDSPFRPSVLRCI